MINKTANLEGIDQEWLQLILEAKKLGLGTEDVQNFLTEMSMKDYAFK